MKNTKKEFIIEAKYKQKIGIWGSCTQTLYINLEDMKLTNDTQKATLFSKEEAEQFLIDCPEESVDQLTIIKSEENNEKH